MEKELIKLLSKALEGRQAHIDFEAAVEGIPLEYCGRKVENLPYTIWQLVEHIRIAQKDILEFSINPEYQAPSWPEDYWPEQQEPADSAQWENALKEIKADRKAFISLLEDPESDLYKPFPQGSGQNLLREALLILDHNSYHTGQIIVMRRLSGIYN